MGRLKSNIVIWCIVGICLIFFAYGCTPPPSQQIADAEAALSAAKEAGAETYAAQEYASAESKLEEARKSLEAMHYTDAKNQAIDARDTALLAKSLAEEAQSKLRAQARDALKTAKDAMRSAELAGAKTHDPKGYRSVEALYGEADTAYIGGHYTTAIQKAEEVANRARRLELAAKRAAEIERERKAKMIKPPPPPAAPVSDRHTVQTGECLWTISGYEQIYANPFQWPLIYRANRSQIKDPDLIYPGQDFMIPRNPDPEEVEDAIYTAKHRGSWSLFDGK